MLSSNNLRPAAIGLLCNSTYGLFSDYFLTLLPYAHRYAFNFHYVCIDLSCREARMNQGATGPCPRSGSCEHTQACKHDHKDTQILVQTQDYAGVALQRESFRTQRVNLYLHTHPRTQQIYASSHTLALRWTN